MTKNPNNSNNVPMDPLSKAFGLDPMDGKLKPNGKVILPDLPDKNYEHCRDNIIDVLEQAKSYMHQFGQVALSAQEPRHFEVLNNMVATIIDGYGRVMELEKLDQDIRIKEESTKSDESTVTNNLYVASTSDLLELMHNKVKKKEDE